MPKNKKSTLFPQPLKQNAVSKLLGVLVGDEAAGILVSFSWLLTPLGIVIILALIALIALNTQGPDPVTAYPEALSGSLTPTSLEGVEAFVLDVPYFNQWLDSDGVVGPTNTISNAAYPLGQIICGAASSTMVAGYYQVLDYSSPNDLKSYATQDKGLGLPNYCSAYGVTGGAFGITGRGYCNQSSFAGISEYLAYLGLQTKYISRNQIPQFVSAGHPVIVSISAPLGHIFVVKGYTADGRFVASDPFGDLNNVSAGYSYRGNNALYDFDNPLFQVNAFLAVTPI